METATATGRARRQPPAARARLTLAVAVLLVALGALVAPGAAFADAGVTPASATRHNDQSATFSFTPNPPPLYQFSSAAWSIDNVQQNTDPSATSFTTPTTLGTGAHTVRVDVVYTDIATGTLTSPDSGSATLNVTNAKPTADITSDPPILTTDPTSTYTATAGYSDPENDPVSAYIWTVDGLLQGATGPSIVVAFASTGRHTITLAVKDQFGAVSTTVRQDVYVANRQPTAVLEAALTTAAVGQAVPLNASASSDPDGQPLTYEFDLGSGTYTPSPGATASATFAQPGTYTVRVRVKDPDGLASEAAKTISVVNGKPPTVRFSFAPTSPVAGGLVSFTATGTNADGSASTFAWDLDNDGQFDDASGATAARAFGAAGNYVVSVKATDPGTGLSAVSFQTVSVGQQPLGPPILTPELRMMSPSPKVLLGYVVIGKVTRITSFLVRGPKGAVVRVRCRGRSCPTKKTLRLKIKKTGKSVRFRRFQRRVRAGTYFQIYITKDGRWGEYRKFRLRASKRAVWTDRCIKAYGAKVQRCPAG